MSLINSMLLELDARQDQHNSIDDNVTSGLQPVTQPRLGNQHVMLVSLAAAFVVIVAFGLTYLPALNQEVPFTAGAAEHTQTSNSLSVASVDTDTTDASHVVMAATKPASSQKLLTDTAIKQTAATTQTASVETTVAQPAATTHSNRVISAAKPDSDHRKITRASTLATRAAPSAKAAARDTASATRTSNDSGSADTTAAIYMKQRLPEAQLKANQHYASALRYYKQGRISESIEVLYLTLQLDPEHAKAREVLSSILIQQQRWQDAEQVLAAGIELNPNQTGFRHLLARLKIEQGYDEEAIAILETPLQQGSTSPESYALLAQLYQRQGQHEIASQYYKQALIAEPGRGKWWLGLGISLEALQQLDDASKAYRLAANSRLEPQLQQYVRQRQQLISQQQATPVATTQRQ